MARREFKKQFVSENSKEDIACCSRKSSGNSCMFHAEPYKAQDVLGPLLQYQAKSYIHNSYTLLKLFSLGNGNSVQAENLCTTSKTENCPDHTVFFKHYYELHGEPVVLKCPSPRYKHLDFSALTSNITWYKNGSNTMISGRDEDARIWAKGNALWFLPVMLEDSGVYICTKRNSSYCAEVSIHLTVMERTAAREIAYPQVLFTFTAGKIVCPDLWDFAPNRTSLELKWYKDALPLEDDNERFIILKGSASLIMTSVLPTDMGYYTCKMSFPFEAVPRECLSWP
ncbi:hypothetical protein IHE44_0005173 [Lamprotornis superbus]|uniref:Ig-like domain-containing protein n=1 Tax=Lamprotornis superbus TaxID=245042 RepID=A0A835NXT5_9PASS|nr:hypothetical protein IHE44_0005173 [Lamprotornis superbus]